MSQLLDALGRDCHQYRTPLILAFHLEVKAIRLLKQTKGLPQDRNAGSRIFCGPLMAHQLGLEAQVGQAMRDLPAPPDELSGFLALRRQLVDDGESSLPDLFDGQARRRLMYCFSELGEAFISVDQGEPHKALRMLAESSCPECSTRPSSSLSSAAREVAVPQVCDGDCVYFAERNPAYALLADRGEVLFHHAIELGAEYDVHPNVIMGILGKKQYLLDRRKGDRRKCST